MLRGSVTRSQAVERGEDRRRGLLLRGTARRLQTLEEKNIHAALMSFSKYSNFLRVLSRLGNIAIF